VPGVNADGTSLEFVEGGRRDVVTVVSTHLENRTTPECRAEQMEEVLSHLKGVTNPVILAGDLNTFGSDGRPMTVERLLLSRFGNPEWVAKQVITRLVPYSGLVFNVSSVVNFIRLKGERGFRPKRDLILALTCGEETSNRVNGVDYLLQNRRELIDAAFALNEGAGGLLSPDGKKPLVLQVQAGEKIHQVFSLEVTNPGGHSSRPVPDNAIYRLAAATQKIAQLSFPVQVNPVVREYFRVSGPLVGGEVGAAMSAVAKNPDDQAALQRLMQDPSYNAVVHTTCVATQLEGGHAPNALPQRAKVTLSCRVMQGTTPEQVQETLARAIGDDQVKVEIVRRRDGSSAPPLTDEIMGPVKKMAAKLWPGVPVAPMMSAGATDGRFLMNAGIPTYGMSGMFSKPDETNAHGLNEKRRVQSLYEGREFLEGVVRAYVK
jgi:acetylornithine deacetylase/succinyl-diaminopimelate desuccinylase-like protein